MPSSLISSHFPNSKGNLQLFINVFDGAFTYIEQILATILGSMLAFAMGPYGLWSLMLVIAEFWLCTPHGKCWPHFSVEIVSSKVSGFAQIIQQ
jgi:hypothetical protein